MVIHVELGDNCGILMLLVVSGKIVSSAVTTLSPVMAALATADAGNTGNTGNTSQWNIDCHQ